jgi:hypothetical protein
MTLFFVVLPSIVSAQTTMPRELQITHAHCGHMLTNIDVWSPDSRWIVYDTRTSLDGSIFNGQTIERVEVATGRVELLYQSNSGANCGVVTYHSAKDRVAFILGPENPTEDWSYSPTHRQGVIVDCSQPMRARNLDARDLTPGFTPGALRGGTHVHTFNRRGTLVVSTYEDAVLEKNSNTKIPSQRNLRGIAVSLLGVNTNVPATHARNHSGESFTVLATVLHDDPSPGSDEIERACEEGWIGENGYRRADGSQQQHAVAFQGTVVGSNGQKAVEVFVLDLPKDLSQLTLPSDQPLEGTVTTRPAPPPGVKQRRITFTTDRKYPGLAQPRHWLRTTPDGQWIFFLAKDDRGVVQVFAVSPNGGPMRQISNGDHSIGSALSVSPDGQWITYVADSSVFKTSLTTGQSQRLTSPTPSNPPRPEACVFSPDGNLIAFMRTIKDGSQTHNQIFVVSSGT